MPSSSIIRGLRGVLTGLAACGVLALPVGSRAQPRFDLGSTHTVLPKTVLPSHVRLELDLDPAEPTFAGRVSIRFRATTAVPAIVVHARELEADAVALSSASRGGLARPVRRLQVQADATTSTWRLVPVDGGAIAAGAYRLDIQYRGKVQTSAQGLFRADYRVKGEPAAMLSTKLEPAYARLVLPVFDEPVFRAVFEVTVRAPKGLQVLSNMPEVATRPAAGRVEHRFAPTPAMPSYLMAVTVGRMDVLEGRSGRVPLRIFTASGKRDQARLAMKITQQVLPFFAQYFGHPYSLPKLDQVATPSTRQGAMEDWGLIGYIESALLFDPTSSSDQTERRIFAVISHEIAHQWFGDLVSVASWNDIWLNEAFATWMEDKAAERFHPEWHNRLRLRARAEGAMGRDGTSATRAIRSGAVNEARLYEVFDDITYRKGGAMLTMLEQWLGADAFRRGLASYMAERAFKPATAGDLWFHIGRAAGQPGVAQVAASWTDQPGFPVLSVAARCEAGRTRVSLSQSRFSRSTPLPGGPWQIPVRVVQGGTRQTLLMAGEQAQLSMPGCDSMPLLANEGGRGFYRVNYDADLWARAVTGYAGLPPSDRVTLLSDSFALARQGSRSMAEHFALLAALPQVRDVGRETLFAEAANEMRLLDQALDGTAAQAPLRAAAQALLAPELDRLGWHPAGDESGEARVLRAALIRELAMLDHAPTQAAARQRLRAALARDGGTVPLSMRAAVIEAAGTRPDDADFDAMMAALFASESDEERRLLVTALARGSDPLRAQRLLEASLAGRLPPNLSAMLPTVVGSVPSLAPQAYRFAVENWPRLLALAGANGSLRHSLLPAVAWYSSDPAMASQMLIDQLRLDGEAGEAVGQQAAATIQDRYRVRERERETLGTALEGWTPR